MTITTLVSFSYLIALVLASFIPNFELFIFFVLLFLLSLFFEKDKKDKVFLIASFCAIFAVLVHIINYEIRVKPVKELDEKLVKVTGEIVELPYKNESGNYCYVFKVKKIHELENPKNFKILLSSISPIEADVYDEFSCEIKIFSFKNTLKFPSDTFYRSKGIYARAFVYGYNSVKLGKTSKIKPLYYYALKLRQKLIVVIGSIFSEKQAGIITGMMLGNKNCISHDIKADFDRIGVYHLLAVSGIHVSILSSIFTLILKRFRLDEKIIALLSILFVFMFMSVSCFTPSVVRAGIMSIICFLATVIKRKNYPINSLSIAVILISIFNPDIGGNIGFLLSVSASLGILVLSKPFLEYMKGDKKLNPYFYGFGESILVSISANIFTFPIIAIYFKKFSLISVVSNILLVLPATMMMFLAFILIVFYYLFVPKLILQVIKLPCEFLVNYIILCSKILSKIPGISINFDFLQAIFCILMISIFSILTYFYIKTKNYYIKLFSFLPMISLILFCIFSKIKMKDLTKISVIDSGSGCNLVFSKNESISAVLCMNEKTHQQKIIDHMRYSDFGKIDSLIILNYGPSNVNFINNFIEIYNPDLVLITSEKLNLNDFYRKDIEIIENSFSLKIFDTTDLVFEKTNYGDFVFLKTLDIKTLICPFENNLSTFPENFSEYDIVVAGGITSDYNEFNFPCTIISMTKKDSDIVCQKIKNITECLLSVADLGTVDIDINKYGNFKLKAGGIIIKNV